ncbi:MAG TPA: hypothetical protein VFB13_12905 [Reyranella sp.]|jgi:hypothetical protein|nr:hypothetical protein [Reyranella sp.]
MEIMRRYERRLARIEASLAWLRQLAEDKKTEPERLRRLAEMLWGSPPPAPAATVTRERPSVRPEPAAAGPDPSAEPLVEPPAPSLRSGRQEMPPRPTVEFVQERAGMSIAIDTRTGGLADSATALAAFDKLRR